MFEGEPLHERKYVTGYRMETKKVFRFQWAMLGVYPSGKAIWNLVEIGEVRKVEVPIMKLARVMHKYGKTARDHATGAHARRLTNHETRKTWDRAFREKGKGRVFPAAVCNGTDTRRLREAGARGGKETRAARDKAAGIRQTQGPPKEAPVGAAKVS